MTIKQMQLIIICLQALVISIILTSIWFIMDTFIDTIGVNYIDMFVISFVAFIVGSIGMEKKND